MADLSSSLQEAVCDAAAAGLRPGIVGARSRPWTRAAVTPLAVAGHDGPVSYQPAELVVTVRAGTTLAELDDLLEAGGQMLACECPDFGGSTIGGALATGWSGARQPFAGSLRDLVLGCRLINGRGESLRFGGQVMKNVAGYDVSRLLSGSRGRLGLITELSLRVHPRPEAELTLVFDCRTGADMPGLVRRVLKAGEPLTGAALCDDQVYLRFSARESTLQRLSAQLGGRPGDAGFWPLLRRLELPFFKTPGAPLWRLRVPPGASLAALEGDCLLDQAGRVCWYRGPEDLARLESLAGKGQAVSIERGPARPAPPEAVLSTLHRRLYEAFDPAGVFSPASGAA
jgi:glycolate oxidase FAD binding subunit